MDNIDILKAVDPSTVVDSELFNLGPLAKPYLMDSGDSEEEHLFLEASKSTDYEKLFIEASECTENQEQQEPPKFGPPVGQEYLESLRDRAVPQSTRKQMKWAVQRWRDWVIDRNKHVLSANKEGIEWETGLLIETNMF